MVVIRNLSRKEILCRRALLADSFGRRALGLMFRKKWEDFDGFVLSPCGAIHTFWMRMAIDVCFLDRDQRVVKVVHGLQPWRLANGGKGSFATLELPVGSLARDGTCPGDQIKIEE